MMKFHLTFEFSTFYLHQVIEMFFHLHLEMLDSFQILFCGILSPLDVEILYLYDDSVKIHIKKRSLTSGLAITRTFPSTILVCFSRKMEYKIKERQT